jgi:hypothetical protein
VRELTADPELVGCVLSAPPVGAGGEANTEVLSALRLGLPILIWQREGYARPDVRAELQDLLSRAVLADLPLWIEALRRSDSGARHVTLLWDDPTCLPDVHATAGTAWSEE